MNDDETSQKQSGAALRPATAGHVEQAALPRSVMPMDDAQDAGAPMWPFAPEHGDVTRQAAPGHDQADASVENEPLFQPGEQPRRGAAEHDVDERPTAVGHGHVDVSDPFVDVINPDESPRPAMVEEAKPNEVVEPKVEEPVVEAPPDSADLVTVEEAVGIFEKRGLPRHMRTIQKYCSRKTGRALVSYQIPTENGIRYMIERSSIDRFIGDAAQQAPTGKLEQDAASASVEREVASAPAVEVPDIFEHPFVQRLEAQVERLESRNDMLQREIQNVLTDANERLVELQKANAVAQSESLGTFLLEAERIRRRQEAVPGDGSGEPIRPNPTMAKPFEAKSSVNREGRTFGDIGV